MADIRQKNIKRFQDERENNKQFIEVKKEAEEQFLPKNME